jgi:hypothetical protein
LRPFNKDLKNFEMRPNFEVRHKDLKKFGMRFNFEVRPRAVAQLALA